MVFSTLHTLATGFIIISFLFHPVFFFRNRSQETDTSPGVPYDADLRIRMCVQEQCSCLLNCAVVSSQKQLQLKLRHSMFVTYAICWNLQFYPPSLKNY